MFQAHDVERYFGASAVLDGASLSLNTGEKVGLVGRNGCGKSTLLRILAGMDRPDRGGVTAARHGLFVGYLPQFPEFPPGSSLLEAVTDRWPPGVPTWKVRKALIGLGFREGQFEQHVTTLSGGEKTRAMLARLLVGEYDLLLLDEPTSHLDIPMLQWLEETLRSYPGTALIVSHDRRFLDNTVSRTLELDGGRLTEYAGNYTAYAEAKRRQRLSAEADYTVQQREISALREFIARQLGWASRGQAGPKRGRDHRGTISAKVARRARAAERRIAHMDIVDKPREAAHVDALLRPARRGSQIVFEARDVSKCFHDRTLFGPTDIYVRQGERVGVIGPNGAGKTTLVRMLLGQITPDTGSVRVGPSVQPLYVAQEQEQMDPRKTVFETVSDIGGLSQTEARTVLACFLFREDEVFKRVCDLSGGERARLAVAAGVVSGANLLVLDEPTNHLDIDTRERLEDAIAAYTGTLLVVSHDRYLLDRLTERTLVLENEVIRDYAGNYTAWQESTPVGDTGPEQGTQDWPG